MKRVSAWARLVLACVLVVLLVAGLVPVLPEAPFALAEEPEVALELGGGGEGDSESWDDGEPTSDDSDEGVVLGDDGEEESTEQVEIEVQDEGSPGVPASTGEESDSSPIDVVPSEGLDVTAESSTVSVSNPRVVKNSSMAAGQVATWDCVWFGFYPQSEVIETEAEEGSELDRVVVATFDSNGDATVDGTRYHRIKRSDTTYDGYFGPNDYDGYRYFRYEPIKWRVHKVDGGTALVIADVALDCQRYNTNNTSVTWETSSIRSWLNGYGASSNQPKINYSTKNFMNTAFNSSQKAAIIQTNVTNASNSLYGTSGGNNTTDKVFLLSESEVLTADYGYNGDYLIYDEARHCRVTDYSHVMGATFTYLGNSSACYWWLRSPGYDNEKAACVSNNGLVSGRYSWVVNYYTVRPAMNINLSSTHVQPAGTVSSDGTVNEIPPTGGSEEDDDSYDHYSGTPIGDYVNDWLDRYGCINTITNNRNFLSSYIVLNNYRSSFANDVVSALENCIYRGVEGWENQFAGTLKVEDAEKTLAGFLAEQYEESQALETSIATRDLAENISEWVKYHFEADLFRNDAQASMIVNFLSEEYLADSLSNGTFNKLVDNTAGALHLSVNSEGIKKLKGFVTSKKFLNSLGNGLKIGGQALRAYKAYEDGLDKYIQIQTMQRANDNFIAMLDYIASNGATSVIRKAAANLRSEAKASIEEQYSVLTSFVLGDAGNWLLEEGISNIIDLKCPWYIIAAKCGFDLGVWISNSLLKITDSTEAREHLANAVAISTTLSKWYGTVVNDFTSAYSTASSGRWEPGEVDRRATMVLYSAYMLYRSRIVSEESLKASAELSMKLSVYKPWRDNYAWQLNNAKSTLENLNTVTGDLLFDSDALRILSSSDLPSKSHTDSLSLYVACPVTVRVIDKAGRTVASIPDGKEVAHTFGKPSGVATSASKNVITGEYVKYVAMPRSAGYRVEMVGTGSGSVSCEVLGSFAGTSDYQILSFDALPIKKGGKITTSELGTSLSASYQYDANGTGTSVKIAEFSVIALPADDPSPKKGLVYNGAKQSGVVVGKGYTLTGTSSAIKAGSYKAVATLQDGFAWGDGSTKAKTVAWTIAACNVGDAHVSGVKDVFYNGKAQTQSLVVRIGEARLSEGTDYTLSYANNVNIGTATVVIKGIGNYGGSKSVTFSILNAGDDTRPVHVAYRTHVQSYGWQAFVRDGGMSGTSGESKRLEGIEVKLEGAPCAGSVEYRTHVQTYGWQAYRRDGAMSGTSGESKRLEAIQIRLTGEMAERYDVWYRVHAQSYGWLGWARNDSPAGTAGLAKRLEGIEIQVLPKGSAAPGQAYGAFVSRTGETPAQSSAGHDVAYRTHVQTFGWQGFVYDGQMSGTQGLSKRLEGIEIRLADKDYPGSVEYRTHVQTYGWQAYRRDGQMSGTSGEAKRLEAIQIRLTGEMAQRYDVWYRVHAQRFGWMGWAKNDGQAGTAGYAYRLEGIQVLVLPKGSAAPGPTANAFVQR